MPEQPQTKVMKMASESVEFVLVRRDGNRVDARVEIEDQAVILHSRGGSSKGRPARNTEYSQAFDLILERLGATVGIERVLVDSVEARAMPEAVRLVALKHDFKTLPLKEVKNKIRREGRALGRADGSPANQGNSTKRLRFETTAMAPQLRRILRAFPAFSNESKSADGTGGPGSSGGVSSDDSSRGGGNLRPSLAEVEAAIADMPLTDEERIWVEGNLKVANHLRRERKPGLASAKKVAFEKHHGRLFCESCLIDPLEEYDSEAALACIEVHHARVQVAEMEEGHITALDDLQCLCANCHRILHRQMVIAKNTGAAEAA